MPCSITGAGDPIKRMFDDMEQGGVEIDESALEVIRAKYGLDKTLPEQFLTYMTNVLQGESGAVDPRKTLGDGHDHCPLSDLVPNRPRLHAVKRPDQPASWYHRVAKPQSLDRSAYRQFGRLSQRHPNLCHWPYFDAGAQLSIWA